MTMDSKFTPGPWFSYVASGMAIVLSKPLEGPCMASAPAADTIASWSGTYDEVRHYWNLPDEVGANARLIAAAPTMLEALKAYIAIKPWKLGKDSVFEELTAKVESAIKLAEGE